MTSFPEGPLLNLPIELDQRPSRVSPWLMTAFALPATLFVTAPVIALGAHAAADESMRATIIERAEAFAILTAGAVLWIAVIGWPVLTRALQIGRHRHVRIADGVVSVVDQGLRARETWSEPLSAFCGLRHVVRATLSGNCHDLILVHPEAKRSILLRSAARMPQAEIDATARLFGCPEIAAASRDDVQQRPAAPSLAIAA